MKPTKFLTALLVFAAALSAKAAPLLNGIAVEQQFNKDRYIAAVYSETVTGDVDTLMDNNTPRRLEVRILAESLSARRFRNQWMEGIAINNSGDTLSGQAENMVTFANLFEGRLRRGDRLTVAFDANSGATSVSLNDLPLGEIQNRDFFNTLLRAWIGPVPPSSDFRDGLLAAGQIPSALLGRYELLEPTAERVAQLTEQLEARGAEETEAGEEQQQVAAKPEVEKPAPKKPQLAAEVPPPTLASLNGQPAAAKPAPKPAAKQPAPAAKRRPPAPEEEPEEEEEEEQPLTADLILARQLYHSMLLRHTFKHTRYPKRAQERGQEGSVRLNVTIDAEGQVRDIQTVQDSRYSSLNREAREAIERSSPYPKAPSQLSQKEYRFTVPITFRLPD